MANGELASQTAGGQTTGYQYDVLGNLTSVTLPSGKAISYLVDAENRRVGKMVNGTSVEGFLYDGDRIVAQVNGNTLVGFPLLAHFHPQQLRRLESNTNASNGLVSRFIYASHATSPDYMISSGVTYRIFSDPLGSPLLVVNTSTGAIAEQITYDEFGNVLSDTNPGFQPFGFAGGLYDQDTKLLRFGARDYDPSVGRWTAKDHILFEGGDTNLYGYVLSDPVNLTDITGTSASDFVWGVVDEYVKLQTYSAEVMCPACAVMVAIRDHDWVEAFVPTGGKDASDLVGGTPNKGSISYFVGQTAVDVVVDAFIASELLGRGGGRGTGPSAYDRTVQRGRNIGKCGRYRGNPPGL